MSAAGPRFQLTPEQRARLREALLGFPRCRILVVGDVMLDVFLWGEVRRISPEAPVPVVEVARETRLPGGAANVVNNLAALGGKPCVAGLVGEDEAGRDLRRLLREKRVSADGLVVERDRPTVVKTRVIAHHQQVVRFDREQRAPMTPESLDKLLAYVAGTAETLDAVVVSDYGKGTVTPELMAGVRDLKRERSLPVLVDPKVNRTELYRGVTLVTPNQSEAAGMSGVEIGDEDSLRKAGEALMDRLESAMVLVTRGKEGMSLYRRGEEPVHIPTVARRVFDVTGAGDTVIATMALGLAAGLDPVESALLANLAAGIVVGEVGTATVPSDLLLEAVGNGSVP